MNNLRKFSTETEYTAATLNYPAVSWVTGTDEVHFDKVAPVVNDKIMIYNGSTFMGSSDIILYNGAMQITPTSYFTSISVNNVEQSDLTDWILEGASLEGESYLLKYSIIGTTIGELFSGEIGVVGTSGADGIDFLAPAQITQINSLPSNIVNLVIEATTPPTTSLNDSAFDRFQAVYVPNSAVSAYQSAWGNQFSSIYPISQYQGNLPI